MRNKKKQYTERISKLERAQATLAKTKSTLEFNGNQVTVKNQEIFNEQSVHAVSFDELKSVFITDATL